MEQLTKKTAEREIAWARRAFAAIRAIARGQRAATRRAGPRLDGRHASIFFHDLRKYALPAGSSRSAPIELPRASSPIPNKRNSLADSSWRSSDRVEPMEEPRATYRQVVPWM